MNGHVTWGCCREDDGSVTRSVFCLKCREVFALRVDIESARAAVENAEAEHCCALNDVSKK